MNYDTAEHTIT